jgi:hypothetical protein
MSVIVRALQQLENGGDPEYVYRDRTEWPCAVFVGKKYRSKGYPQRNVSKALRNGGTSV